MLSRALLVGVLVLSFSAAAEAQRVSGKILRVLEDQEVSIDVGAQAGVTNRMVFDVYQPARMVKLPLTNEVAYVPERVVARLVVVDAEPSTAKGRLVAPPGGTLGKVAAGDLIVSNPMADAINIAPFVRSLTASPLRTKFGQRVTLSVDCVDEAHDRVYYVWAASAGVLSHSRSSGPQVTWLPPREKGKVTIGVSAVDTAGNKTRRSVVIDNGGFTDINKNVYEARGFRGGHSELYKQLADIAFDELGVAYLVDAGNERVLGMDEAWREVMRTAEPSETYAFERAVVARGGFYAIDRRRGSVLKFALGPKMFQGKPSTVYGAKGSGNGRFSKPIDLQVDAEGHVYVLDGADERGAVHVFAADGRFALSIGAFGDGQGYLKQPVGIGIAHDGTLYVADNGRKRVLIFRAFRYVSEFAIGSATDTLGDVKVDPYSGRVSVLVSNTGKVHSFAPDGSALGAAFGGIGNWMSMWQEPQRLRYDAKGMLYLLAAGGNTIHTIDADRREEVARWGGTDLRQASRISVSLDGQLAMLLPSDKKVALLDSRGWITALAGGEGEGVGKLEDPVDVLVDKDGNLCVLDADKDRVEVFSPAGNPLRVVGKPGSGAAEIDRPVALASDPGREHIVVLEARDQWNVKVFDLKGELRAAFPGKEDFLDDIQQAFMTERGLVNVGLDSGAIRYFDVSQKLSGRRFVEAKGTNALHKGDWSLRDVDEPARLQLSNIGLLFALERGGAVQVVDLRQGKGGATLFQIKDPKNLSEAADVAVDAFDRVFVWDSSNKRAVVYER